MSEGDSPELSQFGVYFHIPYCKSICPFCSFPVFKDRSDTHKSYFEFLKKETRLRFDVFREKRNAPASVYFGGGTPSRIPVPIWQDFFAFLKNEIFFSPKTQISFEINPEDFSEILINSLRDQGVNRFSIGIQSFFDEHLKFLGRSHNTEHCNRCLDFMRKDSLLLWNVDLMYGFPAMRFEEFCENLRRTIASGCDHVSLYGLTIEQGTPFAKNRPLIEWTEKFDFQISKQYEEAVRILEEAGIRQYELSNFARPGFRSEQNEIYWSDKEYIGIGVGAHSYTENQRIRNFTGLKKWQCAIKESCLPFEEVEAFEMEKRLDEFLLIGFRCVKGIQEKEITAKFGAESFGLIKQICCNSFTEDFLTISRNAILPSSKGMLFADDIALQVSSHLKQAKR